MIGDDQNMRNYIKGPSRVGQPRASADGRYHGLCSQLSKTELLAENASKSEIFLTENRKFSKHE